MASPPGPLTQKSIIELANENDLAPVQATEKLWHRDLAISGQKWNRAYPYQLIVVEQTAPNTYIPRSERGWTFTLPIPPEALSITTPFAISTAVTLGGYIEEHGGNPIRMINLSGSTGVFFGRTEAPAAPDATGLTDGETIFAGTLSATAATRQASRELREGKSFVVDTVPQSAFDDGGDMAKLTGYYQFRLLQLFLEAYAEMKRTRDGRRARLAFAMWKDEAVYLCAPQQFEYHRTPGSPFEYMYSLQLKAHKRVKLSTGVADIRQVYIPVQRDPGKLATLLQTVEQARAVLQNAKKTIQAIGGDVRTALFEPMREMCLFAKDALSVPLSVADLADSIIADAKRAIIDLKGTANAISNFPDNLNRRLAQVTRNATDVDFQIGQLAAEQTDDPYSNHSGTAPLMGGGHSFATGAAPAMGPSSSYSSRAAHPANSPFLNPADNFDFFSGISVGDLHLAPSTMARIADERQRVRNLTRLDFEKKRDAIRKTATNFANAIGLGSATYNEIHGIDTPPAPVVDTPTDEDYEVIFALNRLVIEMNRLVVTNDNDPNPKLDSISAVAGLASRSGIAFRIPRSKYAAPFPYGSTLEMLAARYLGDPGRWHEIAALNGLQTPYVDEVGFELPLLVNGADNTVLLSSTTQMFVGQPVWISSRGVSRQKRRITKIDHLAVNQHLVTVTGLPDLDRYTTAAGATLQAFLPNTVNSQMVIYIPSDTEPKDEDFKTKSIPGIDEYDRLLAVGGIDLLLTPTNDLVITPDGDARWAVGLVNIVQKVRLALATRQGTLLGHPSYGLPIAPGESVADLDAVDLVRAGQELFNGDPTFTGVRGANINVTGPVAKIGLAVGVAGQSQVIPISAEVKQ